MRDTWIVAVVIVAAVAVGGLLYLYGGPAFHQSSLPQKQSNSTFSVIASGEDAAGVDSQVNYRITDPDQFAALWKMIYSDNGPGIPTIDFDQNEVLAVFSGSHSTDGYDVKVHDVQDVGGKRIIDIIYTSPGASCNTNSTPNSPFVLVQVAKTDLPVTHVEEQQATDCSQ